MGYAINKREENFVQVVLFGFFLLFLTAFSHYTHTSFQDPGSDTITTTSSILDSGIEVSQCLTNNTLFNISNSDKGIYIFKFSILNFSSAPFLKRKINNEFRLLNQEYTEIKILNNFYFIRYFLSKGELPPTIA